MSQPEQYSQRVQGIITGIITRVRWNELFAELFNMDNPYSDQELSNTECRVGYEKFSNENRAWANLFGANVMGFKRFPDENGRRTLSQYSARAWPCKTKKL
jgi:hypothetical protein